MNAHITVFGTVNIVSEAKNNMLFRGLNVVFDCLISPVEAQSDEAFRKAIERQLIPAGHDEFVNLLKLDSTVKRAVGGTKWKVEVLPNYKVFSSMKIYQETAANGHLYDDTNICNDIPFMRGLVQDAIRGGDCGDPYFKDFLDNL